MKTEAISSSSFGAKTSNGKAVETPKVNASSISLSQCGQKLSGK